MTIFFFFLQNKTKLSRHTKFVPRKDENNFCIWKRINPSFPVPGLNVLRVLGEIIMIIIIGDGNEKKKKRRKIIILLFRETEKLK